MKKQLVYVFPLSLFFFFAKAQQKNTKLHIFYAPGIADIYSRYGSELKIFKTFQLSTLENYLQYQPVAQSITVAASKEAMVSNTDVDFYTDKPSLYYLLINTNNKYAGVDYENPVHWLWLGKGRHQIDVYSVTESEKELNNEGDYLPKNNYRFYYEGIYEKENKFLLQYIKAGFEMEKKLQLMAQERYKNYYDSSDAEKNKRVIDMANRYAAVRDTFFNSIDSCTAQLNAVYKNYFPKLNADFDKVMEPELRSFGNAFKMYYCTSFLSAFNNVQTVHKTEIVKIAESIRKQMDGLPLQLSCESYRNTYFGYVNAMMWAGRIDTVPFANHNQVFYESISPIISRQFVDRPKLAEYLHAASVYFMVNFMSYEATTISRIGFQHFQIQYPTSVYNSTLETVLFKKEEELKKKDGDISKVYGDTATADSTAASVADTLPVEEVTLEATAITPPKIPNDIDDKEVKFWNLNLYTAHNKVVKLKNLKGKRIAVKALCSLPESRDMAYFQYLEKKFPALVFVYIFKMEPNPAALKLFQSFNLKGQCLFMKTALKDDKSIGLWSDEIYYPYWQFINAKGRIKHIYQLDNVEKLISQWIEKSTTLLHQ